MQLKENWQRRGYLCLSPKFRVDYNNPQMGLNAQDVYSFMATTDNNEVNVCGLTEGGIYKIYNDRSIEIVGGKTNNPGGIDITITSKHGDICITAEKNGNVRIRAKNITLDADENININAGKNVNVRAGTRFIIQSNQADCTALTGNLAPQNSSFGEKVFGGGQKATKINPSSDFGMSKPPVPSGGVAYVGGDIVSKNTFYAEDVKKFSSGTKAQKAQQQSILDQLISAGVSVVKGGTNSSTDLIGDEFDTPITQAERNAVSQGNIIDSNGNVIGTIA